MGRQSRSATDMKAPIATELQCEATIIAAARAAGWRVHGERTVHTASGDHLTAIKGDRGFPDLVLVRGEQLIFIELKRDGAGRIGPGQQEWVDALDNVPGVRAMIIYVPSDMNRLIHALQRRP